jgi:hypothetical protein
MQNNTFNIADYIWDSDNTESLKDLIIEYPDSVRQINEEHSNKEINN